MSLRNRKFSFILQERLSQKDGRFCISKNDFIRCKKAYLYAHFPALTHPNTNLIKSW